MLLITGCASPGADDALPAPTPLSIELPTGFPPLEIPADNPTTVEGVALGRQLYYDRRVSPDGSRACADCHLQASAFGNPAVAGILPHINLGWSQSFLWNGGYEGGLEAAMYLELTDFFQADAATLREPDLQERFLAAFGTSQPDLDLAAKALAQFQRTMISGGSRFDAWVAGDTSALSEAERRGMNLFFYGEKGSCFSCHQGMLFTDNAFHDIGLDPAGAVVGTGRAAITGLSEDDGRFKTPTLRNLGYTAPYMHDDRFGTLEEVVEHYRTGVLASPNLSEALPVGGLGFDEAQKADLVAFLRALDDEAYTLRPDLAAP